MAEKKLKKLSKKRSTRSAASSSGRKTSARKTSARKSTAKTASADSIRESASQIWLAGLGAVSKAQEEGAKFFENLVRDGLNLEKKTRKATNARINEVKDAVEDRVDDVQTRASSSWEKLEKVFEDRVAKALSGLGVPTRDDVRDLNARVRDLQRSVDELAVAKAGGTGSRKKATKKARKKTVAKKATSKKATAKKAATRKATTRKTTARKKTTKKAASKS